MQKLKRKAEDADKLFEEYEKALKEVDYNFMSFKDHTKWRKHFFLFNRIKKLTGQLDRIDPAKRKQIYIRSGLKRS